MGICDMIKANDLDITNFDFNLQAKRGDKSHVLQCLKTSKNCPSLCICEELENE